MKTYMIKNNESVGKRLAFLTRSRPTKQSLLIVSQY